MTKPLAAAIRLAGFGLAAWLAAAPPAAAAERRAATGLPALADRLGAVLATRELNQAQVAALVVRESDGHTLYERAPDRLLTPASNQKILTASAVLAAFGPSHQFETRFFAPAMPDKKGNLEWLAVQGGGDPVMNSEDWWLAAAALRRIGVRAVRTGILLDDSLFDGERWHPGWGQPSARAYHAPISALTANYGSFEVSVRAGARAGDPVSVSLEPSIEYFELSNRARTGDAKTRSSLVVDRAAGKHGEHVAVRGTLPAGSPPELVYRSVLDPVRYAGAIFAAQLGAHDIRVDGPIRAAPVPASGVLLHTHAGRPLAEIVRLLMKYSSNPIAEVLVKNLAVQRGEVGSWSSGTTELRKQLIGLGVPASEFAAVDGSGLAYQDKVTPRALVQLLLQARKSFAFGPELIASLPIANRDGTLERRADLSRDRVRAKTGLLNGVSALSGIAEIARGEVVAFSVIVNGYRCSDEAAMQVLDRFVAELATSTHPAATH